MVRVAVLAEQPLDTGDLAVLAGNQVRNCAGRYPDHSDPSVLHPRQYGSSRGHPGPSSSDDRCRNCRLQLASKTRTRARSQSHSTALSRQHTRAVTTALVWHHSVKFFTTSPWLKRPPTHLGAPKNPQRKKIAHKLQETGPSHSNAPYRNKRAFLHKMLPCVA